MAQKQFNQFGLRRDLNLSDLPSPVAALNNILATPTMLGSEKSFTTKDLEPIRGIFVTNITASTFNSLDGVTVAFTIVEGGVIDNNANPKVYRPLIKIKNRLDAAYFSTGEPFFFGGDGPNAKYYDNSEIVRDAEIWNQTKSYPIGSVVRYNSGTMRLYRKISVQDGTPGTGTVWLDLGPYVDLYFSDSFDSDGNITTLSDNFWERGNFVYSEKLQTSFLSLFGGTNWQGFYKPTVSGDLQFLINTTGSTVFKFQDPSSKSFQAVRYGKPNSTAFTFFNAGPTLGGTPYNANQISEILNIYNDSTRQLVEVGLEDAMSLKHGDLVFLDVEEGQVPPQRYRILTPWDYDLQNKIPVFYIEITEEFNKLNLNSNDLDTVNSGINWNLSTGTYSANTDDIEGLKAVVRYTPFERKDMKTYLKSYRHKTSLEIGNDINIQTATTFTISDEQYLGVMINDYIYDYRLRPGDVDGNNDLQQGIRRFIITNCTSDGVTNTVTVELDSNYTFDEDLIQNNDQQYYFKVDQSTGEFSVQEQFELDNDKITEVYTTGTLNETLSSENTYNKLLHVARMGELITRQRYINISQYLDRYIDYVFDWTFFIKDEDVDPGSTNKAWILRQRTETSGGYGRVSYKHLYAKDYEFYQIGDFKTFLDNSVLAGGTSREEGVEQRAFGKPQLIQKGDQYNTLYTLLPIKSIYSPKENWNGVALSRNGTMEEDSRLINLNNVTDIEPGNYIVRDTVDGFEDGQDVDYGTRILDVLANSGAVIVNKEAITPFNNQPIWVLDHRGFIATGNMSYNSGSGKHIFKTNKKRIPDIKVGQVICFKDTPSQSTYVRITRIDEIPNDDEQILLTLDDQNPYPTSNPGQVAIYNDKGIDITKPLDSFCTGTACAQNNYQGDGKSNTRYIAIRVMSNSANPGLDIRWTESSLTGSYGGTQTLIDNSTGKATFRHPTRIIHRPNASYVNGATISQNLANISGPTVSWWVDARAGSSFPDQATRVGGGNNPSGVKRYGGNQIYVDISGSDLRTQIDEILNNKISSGEIASGSGGTTNTFPDYIPIGIGEGIVRIDGDLQTDTDEAGSERYYFIIRLVESIKSVPETGASPYNPTWKDYTLASDNTTKLPVEINLTEFPSSAFNITKVGIPQEQDNMLPNGGGVSNASQVMSKYNQAQAGGIIDRIYKVAPNNGITLTPAQAQTAFVNPTAFAQDDGNGNVTYLLKQNTFFKVYSTTGYLMYFDTFESITNDETLFTYRPPNGITNTDVTFLDDPELINLFFNNGPTAIESNDWQDQFPFMQYRNKVYQIAPSSIDVERRLPGIRFIHPNPKTTYPGTTDSLSKKLQNTTNALSVYTFTNTTAPKELCCPPLDTSPPFDSSEIGLSTTTANPDFHVAGLVNVRSIGAKHPQDKIHEIPSNITNADLPVNETLEIVFGGVKYKLLVGNTKPF